MKKQVKEILRKILPESVKDIVRKSVRKNIVTAVNEKYGSGIADFKDKYCGKRCFIIGNGPSLSTKDLERLDNELTFASHFIYKIFDKTEWRPNFYCVEDIEFLENNVHDIMKLENDYSHGFFTGNCYKNLPKPFLKNNKNDFWLIDKADWTDYPDFSLSANKYIAEGYTVTYAVIQLAVYMGFTEIYLLGVDHFYESGNSYSSAIGEMNFYNIPQTDKTTLSYIKARRVCEKQGIKIMNATRGGHLEVFERVNFDSVIGEKNEQE